MSKWWGVNEKLPEQQSEVLVRYHAHFDDEEISEYSFCIAYFGVDKFYARDQNFYTRRKVNVTHWMTLPNNLRGE